MSTGIVRDNRKRLCKMKRLLVCLSLSKIHPTQILNDLYGVSNCSTSTETSLCIIFSIFMKFPLP